MGVVMPSPASISSPTTEPGKSLRGFRAGFYAGLTGWPDAVFELCEAMLCAPGPVSSVPALSLGPGLPTQPRQLVQMPGPRRGRPGRDA